MYRDLTFIPVIDSHIHVFPPRHSRILRRWFERHAWRFHDEGTAEELIQRQFDNGVKGLFLLSYAIGPGMAEELNRFVSSLVKKFPQTVGFATVHPGDKYPRDILKRAFEELGLCGVKLHCHVQRVAPDDPLLYPVYESIIDLKGILNMHAGREPSTDAYGMDVRAITGADRVEKVLERYPEMRMIIPHLGFDEFDRFYAFLDDFPNLYLDTTMMMGSFFDVRVSGRKLTRYADRILYGSDYPQIPYEMETEVKAIVDLALDGDTTRKILSENARKLFSHHPFS